MQPLLDELLDEDDLSPAFAKTQSARSSSLCSQTIATLPQRTPICLSPTDSLETAINLMKTQERGAVLVIENKRLQGIFTERDVLNRVMGKTLDLTHENLADYMTPNPETLTPQDTVGFVLNRMTVGGYRRVPIVNAQGEPCGMVSVKDILRYIVDERPCEVYNLRPNPLRKGFARPEGE